ncbi:SGNH/GDSL hydrolase family protein [Agromyces sp. NPDC058484]|uniref:SGNH/GDSL hydrolase family protein n=1 Tax=Agromyces sp. NPDC058484 TaxID=3346524 RepID=UPI0036575347
MPRPATFPEIVEGRVGAGHPLYWGWWSLLPPAIRGSIFRRMSATTQHGRFPSRFGAVSLITAGLVLAGAVPAAALSTSSVPAVATASAAPSSNWWSSWHRDYVALGDSFTAGQGAPPYKPGPCLQSRYTGYPTIAATFSRYRLTENKACSGATVADTTAQLAGVATGTDLVTLTVGAIDVGSNDVLAACALNPDPTVDPCKTAIEASTVKLAQLGPQLVGLYTTIAATLPEARIVVLNYPHLFNPGVAPLGDLVNTATDALNVVIAGAVAASGNPRVAYVDATQEFAGHGIGSRLPYISFDQNDVFAVANFHPNVLGNSLGYARALSNDRVLSP